MTTITMEKENTKIETFEDEEVNDRIMQKKVILIK
jgi:hypothetical protein